MLVTVKLFAALTRFKRDTRAGKAFEVDLPDNATVSDLVDHLKIPIEETHIIFINNIIQEPGSPLSAGDVIGIFPPVGGG